MENNQQLVLGGGSLFIRQMTNLWPEYVLNNFNKSKTLRLTCNFQDH